MAKTLLYLSLDEQHTSTPRLCDLPPRSSTPRQESIRTRPERAPGKRPVFTQVETELAVPHTRDRQPVLHYIAKSELKSKPETCSKTSLSIESAETEIFRVEG